MFSSFLRGTKLLQLNSNCTESNKPFFKTMKYTKTATKINIRTGLRNIDLKKEKNESAKQPIKLLAQQVPTFLLFCNWRSVAQHCCARLHGTTTMLASWKHLCMSIAIKQTDATSQKTDACCWPTMLRPFVWA